LRAYLFQRTGLFGWRLLRAFFNILSLRYHMLILVRLGSFIAGFNIVCWKLWLFLIRSDNLTLVLIFMGVNSFLSHPEDLI
jgi:hypothetical protein